MSLTMPDQPPKLPWDIAINKLFKKVVADTTLSVKIKTAFLTHLETQKPVTLIESQGCNGGRGGIKLVALKASSIRGIPKDWPILDIGEKGLIVYGPNGVGKSSIIDALEFALTGQSTLFSREGQGFSWDNASPHVRHGPPEITLSLKDSGTIRDLKAASPIPSAFSSQARNWIETAKKSKFVLRRHMLLRFISEQPSNRYDLLEPFFNMEAFSCIESDLQAQITRKSTDKSRLDSSIQAIETQLRTRFVVQSTTILCDANLYSLLNATLDQIGLARCTELAALAERKSEVIQQLGGKGKTERIGALQALKIQVQRLGSPHTLGPLLDNFITSLAVYEKEVSYCTQEVMTEFLAQGRDIITNGELDACPLCEEAIKDRTVLSKRLNERIADDEKITTAKVQTVKARAPLMKAMRELHEAINRFMIDWKLPSRSELPESYSDASTLLTQILPIIDDSSATHAQLAHYPALIGTATLEHSTALKIIEDLMSLEGAGERHTLLGRADSMIDGLLKDWGQHKELSTSCIALTRSISSLECLYAHAVQARKETVQAMVDEVSTTANSFYETIHPDEMLATSKLAVREATSASVEIKASFHGEEAHPMRFLSESHLDTLGLCYFLALCKRQTNATPNFRLLILDDVMHSVDAAHRVRVAKVLKTHFDDFQIIVTTHDEPFYKRLLHYLGNSGYSYKTITDWHIVKGPIMGDSTTNLEKITNEAIRTTMSRDSLAATGGIFLEWLLKELTESLNISIQARFKQKHTLDTLWKPSCSKMKDHKGFRAAHPKLADNLDANIWVRNECGGHDNDTASAPTLPEVQEFAALLADLYNATWCPGCREFIKKCKDDGWRCVCAKLNYPKNPTVTMVATPAIADKVD